jgi:nitroimidazol reductase NimA-like FMN-containing flavoprotein (pyridoxamine 5'-phosphate oxidase superfamily)
MSDDEVATFLQTHWWMVIGTQGPGGFPHLVSMAYGFLDGRLAFTSFAKAQKVVNLRRDPRITCLVEEGQDDYALIRGVQISGTVEIIEGAESAMAVARSGLAQKVASRGPAAEATAEEITAISRVEELAAKRATVVVTPVRTISWDHRRLEGHY